MFLLLLVLSGSLCVFQIPVVQVSRSITQVCCKAQPCQVRSLAPARNRIHGSPQVGQVAIESQQGNDVNGSFNRALCDEEERHPGEVEAKLDGVNGHAMLCCLDGLWRGQRGEADVSGAVGGVSHESCEYIKSVKQIQEMSGLRFWGHVL